MNQENSNIQDLITRYLAGDLNEAELLELEHWKSVAYGREELLSTLAAEGYLQNELAKLHQVDQFVQAQLQAAGYAGAEAEKSATPDPRIHIIRKWSWAAAAILFIVLSGTYLWYKGSQVQLLTSNNKQVQEEIVPGKEGAILTLEDGTELVLDSLTNGVIATQNGSRVVLKDGQLAYDATEQAVENITYNSIRTPKGRQFNLQLADGSRVWLNAASSIRFPAKFNGDQRLVEISGEVYLEVAQNNLQPFIVRTDKAEIQVLGTAFNITAYPDESTQSTTLVEGAVRVSPLPAGMNAKNSSGTRDNKSVILRPGQQAELTQHTETIQVIDHVDMDRTLAWKNGIFYFQNASLPTVMKQLERWYDIDVEFTGNLPVLKISGKMDRGLSLQEILDFLAKMEVKYSISGRKVSVHGS